MTYMEEKHHNRTIIQNMLPENLDEFLNRKELYGQKEIELMVNGI